MAEVTETLLAERLARANRALKLAAALLAVAVLLMLWDLQIKRQFAQEVAQARQILGATVREHAAAAQPRRGSGPDPGNHRAAGMVFVPDPSLPGSAGSDGP